LFFGYLGALVGGVILFGTPLGATLWGLAFAAHLVSIQEGVFTGWRSLQHRLGFGILIGGLLFMLIYRPAFQLWNRQVAAVRVVETLGDFRPGDVIWYRPGRQPGLGDWIHFQQPQQIVPVRTNYQVAIGGPWFGQVIALPGQSIDWTRELLIDGIPSPYVDASHPRPMLQPLVVPDDYVAVLPYAEYSRTPIPANVQGQMMLVPDHQLEGVLLWRNYPFWRLTRF
jgi:hypothetical protein